MDARPAAMPPAQPIYTHVVHHGGNTYFATCGMATIFQTNAQLIRDRGETELVPLLHSAGVELLNVGPQTLFTVVAIEVGTHSAH